MGKRSEEKTKTEIQQKMYKILLIERDDKKKLKTAKKLGKKQGMTIKSKNIGEIARRKLEEDIIPKFQEAGIDFWRTNILTRGIIDQIIMYARNGGGLLDAHNYALMPKPIDTSSKKANNERQKKQVRLQKANPFSKMFARIRKFFAKSKRDITEEEINQAKNNIELYEQAGEKLENYNFRENIVEIIVNQICPQGGLIQLGRYVPGLINREVEPILRKLGLGDLIPELQERLIQRYEAAEAEFCKNSPDARAYRIPNFNNSAQVRTNGLEEGFGLDDD